MAVIKRMVSEKSQFLTVELEMTIYLYINVDGK